MQTPYSLKIVESCEGCGLRGPGYFCDFPSESLQAFESLKFATVFPKGAILFVEGQAPRGVFMLCAGRVKLSSCSSGGRSLITRIAEPGEMLGLSATISSKPYMVTAETLVPSQVNFIKRADFLSLISNHCGVACRAAEQLSENYCAANDRARSLALSSSAAEKLAKLILDWCDGAATQTDRGAQLKLALTHEEIAELIGSSRETVTRMVSSFKAKGLIHLKGSTLIVMNREALQNMVGF